MKTIIWGVEVQMNIIRMWSPDISPSYTMERILLDWKQGILDLFLLYGKVAIDDLIPENMSNIVLGGTTIPEKRLFVNDIWLAQCTLMEALDGTGLNFKNMSVWYESSSHLWFWSAAIDSLFLVLDSAEVLRDISTPYTSRDLSLTLANNYFWADGKVSSEDIDGAVLARRAQYKEWNLHCNHWLFYFLRENFDLIYGDKKVVHPEVLHLESFALVSKIENSESSPSAVLQKKLKEHSHKIHESVLSLLWWEEKLQQILSDKKHIHFIKGQVELSA